MKYRLKIEGNRVIGPFTIESVYELYLKEKISDDDEIQNFPEGEWTSLLVFEDFITYREKHQDSTIREDTFMFKIGDFNKLKNNDTPKIKEEVKKPKDDKNKSKNKPESKPEENKTSTDFGVALDLNPGKYEETEFQTLKEKTKISKQNKKENPELDKTKVNQDYQEYLAQLKKEKEAEEKLKQKEKRVKEEEDNNKPDFENDQTQMVSLAELQDDLFSAIELEEVFEDEEKKKIQEKKDKKESEKRRREEEENEEEEDEGENKNKKIIVALIILLGLFFMFDSSNESKSKKVKYVPPKITFPNYYDKPDLALAEDYYNKGLLALRDETYESKLDALKYFKKSYENNKLNNPASAKIIFYYTDVLRNSDDFVKHANVIFSLVTLFEKKIYESASYASAASYFFYQIGKYDASLKVFDKYRTLNPSKASGDLFAIYILSALEVGQINNAKLVAEQLEKISNKSLFVRKALIKFYKTTQKIDKYNNAIEEGNKLFPKSVFFDIEKGFASIEQQNYEYLEKMINSVAEKKYEKSKFYYSNYLILKGFLLANKSKFEVAAKYFDKSLALTKSNLLIEKLSELSQSENEIINKVIQFSKGYKYIKEGEAYLDEGDLKGASRSALRASLEAPRMIEPKLFLSKVQIKSGYIDDAIKGLEELDKKFSDLIDDNYKDKKLRKRMQREVNYAMAEAYLAGAKYRKVKEILNIISASYFGKKESEKPARYKKLNARLLLEQGKYNSAVGWYVKACNTNPLDDEGWYELAQLYMKYHEYRRARTTLNYAMNIDPANVDYKLAYAKIIYEVDGSDTAIGYLFDVIKDFPDNPKILSAIGIYYFRSGQISNYEETRKKILSLPTKDRSLYDFLIESARLDDDINLVIKHSKKLLEMHPGDLETRLKLATIFINTKQYKKGITQLEEIESRYANYPMLKFTWARLNFLAGKIDDKVKVNKDGTEEVEKGAKTLVLEEIKENPTVVDSYMLLGQIYIKEKKLSKAKNQYIKALTIDKRNIKAMIGLAYVALRNNQYDMAIDQYKKAKKINENNPEIYWLLGEAYRSIGQNQLAIKNYKTFLELDPESEYKSGIESFINKAE